MFTTRDRIKHCIVQCLELDLRPEAIADEAPLFGPTTVGGLGLDSLAALEIVVALSKEFGLLLDSVPREAFISVASLGDFIEKQMPPGT